MHATCTRVCVYVCTSCGMYALLSPSHTRRGVTCLQRPRVISGGPDSLLCIIGILQLLGETVVCRLPVWRFGPRNAAVYVHLGRGMLRLGCRTRICQPTVLLCTPLAPLPFMLSLSVDRDGCTSPYLLKRDRGKSFRLLT